MAFKRYRIWYRLLIPSPAWALFICEVVGFFMGEMQNIYEQLNDKELINDFLIYFFSEWPHWLCLWLP